ncbi:hypothetical protein L798_04606 [Zootermopsis nevadensis]|uniref:Uncharacterized protein n=1 Tax=Zootermopsis nevadensis TaxID=136037 RepID=A0A067RAD8_ZOONE|nr:hypothetical protein L798_04606 [Zootermopsis nevadensis]
MKKIRRRFSQTFRFSIEESLSELAEHLTIDDGGSVKENGVHVIPGFSDLNRKLSLSHSRIMCPSLRDGLAMGVLHSCEIFPNLKWCESSFVHLM